jgi:hypothetical protein
MKAIRLLIGTAILATGLAVGATQAFAASASTQLSFTIPVTLSMSGFQASYAGQGPAGSTTPVDMTGISVSTNNPTGYSLTVASTTASFQGSGTHSFASTNDDVHIIQDAGCPSGDTCLAGAALSTGATPILTRSTATTGAGDSFGIRNQITPPASSAPDTYSITEQFVAATQ